MTNMFHRVIFIFCSADNILEYSGQIWDCPLERASYQVAIVFVKRFVKPVTNFKTGSLVINSLSSRARKSVFIR